MNKVVRIFLDADLRCQHKGLASAAKKESVDVRKLPIGEHVMFINRKRNKLKMYSAGEIVAYLRLPKGVLDLRALGRIPEVYGSNLEIKYAKSLEEMIRKEFSSGKKSKRARVS